MGWPSLSMCRPGELHTTKEADSYRIWCITTHTRPAPNAPEYAVGRAVAEQVIPPVQMPRQKLARVRRALQAKPGNGNGTPRDVLGRARTGGPLLSRASTWYSPFVLPDLNLMLVKELSEETPGFVPYVWDSSVRDFVELQACAIGNAPDEDSSMGAETTWQGEGAAGSGGAPGGGEPEGKDDDTNPWLVRAAKKQKEGAEVLFDQAGDMSSDAAMAMEYAEANPAKAAQMVSFTGRGGGARSPSLFALARPTRSGSPALGGSPSGRAPLL